MQRNLLFQGLILVLACASAKNVSAAQPGVDAISYHGGVLDAIYENKVGDDILKADADIVIEFSGAAASWSLLNRLVQKWPSDDDASQPDLIPVGILELVLDDGAVLKYYTDGQRLCTLDLQCVEVGVAFRSLIDPSYHPDTAMFRTFTSP